MSEVEGEFDGLFGAPLSHDRRWLIDTGKFSAVITEYNWELTGFDPRLRELAPDIFIYGGNAYYITGTLAAERGWKVTAIQRKR